MEAYLHEVCGRYPDLEVQTVRAIDEGKVNKVLVVNETIIFRFPKATDGVCNLLTEITVLETIRGGVS